MSVDPGAVVAQGVNQVTGGAASGGWMPAVAGIIGDLVNAGVSVYNTNRTNKANRELAQAAWQHDLNMWNLANEYNTPANQRARMEAAGYNPNLFYSQGNVGNAAQTMPQYRASKDERFDFHLNGLANLSAYFDATLKAAQTDNVRKQNVEIEENIANKVVERGVKEADLAQRNFDYELAKELRQNSIDYAEAETRKRTQELINLQVNQSIDEKMLNDIMPRQMQELEEKIKYQQYVNELSKYGLTPHDSPMTRWLYIKGLPWVLDKFGVKDIPEALEKLYYLNWPQEPLDIPPSR